MFTNIRSKLKEAIESVQRTLIKYWNFSLCCRLRSKGLNHFRSGSHFLLEQLYFLTDDEGVRKLNI